jgi:hypothetical protein
MRQAFRFASSKRRRVRTIAREPEWVRAAGSLSLFQFSSVQKLYNQWQNPDNPHDRVWIEKSVAVLEARHPFCSVKILDCIRDHRLELERLQTGTMDEKNMVLKSFEDSHRAEVLPFIVESVKQETERFVVSKLVKLIGLFGCAYEHEHVFHVLKPFLFHVDSRVRANAVEGLGALKVPQKCSLLLELLFHDENDRVRQIASMALSYEERSFGKKYLYEGQAGDLQSIRTPYFEKLNFLNYWIDSNR